MGREEKRKAESGKLKGRIVVCAAIRSVKSGRILCGARHFDSIMRSHAAGHRNLRIEWRGADQGFIDQFGVFLTRKQAFRIAKKSGQVRFRFFGDKGFLFSENLY